MSNSSKIFFKGIADVSPLMIPVIPFGIIFGVLAVDLGFSAPTIIAVSYTHLTLPTNREV